MRDKKNKPSGGAEGFKGLSKLFKTIQLYGITSWLSCFEEASYVS